MKEQLGVDRDLSDLHAEITLDADDAEKSSDLASESTDDLSDEL